MYDFLIDGTNTEPSWKNSFLSMHYYDRTVWGIYLYESKILLVSDFRKVMREYPFYLGKVLNAINSLLIEKEKRQLLKIF